MMSVRGGVAAAAVAAAGLFVSAAGGQSDETSCAGTLSDVTVQRLVVPAGETCTLTNVTVADRATVSQDATLLATEVDVGGDIRVRPRGTLRIQGLHVEIGGDVIAHDPPGFGLGRAAIIGATFHVAGDVVVSGADRGAGLSGVTVDGDVKISKSGAEHGVTLQLNEIGGKAEIVDNTIVGEEFKSAFFIIGNTVSDDLIFSRNDATNAFEPSLIVGNVVLHGDLVCRNNVPGVSDNRPGLETPNQVLEGDKVGQCADF
jgi:hypothetical protein